MHQNTAKQWGKKSSLYTESTRGSTSISCADAGTYMNKPSQGICLFDLRRRTCHMYWFTMYAHLGKDRPQAAETVGNILCDLLLGTITVGFSPPNKPPSLRCVTTCVHVQLLSFSLFLILLFQHWGCSIRGADGGAHSTRTKTKRFATGLSKLSTSRKPNATQHIWTFQYQPTESKLLWKWTASG